MDNGSRAGQLDALVAIWTSIEIVEQSLAAAQQDRHDRQVHFVDQASPEILLDGRCTATNPDVLAVGGNTRLL